MMFQSGKDLQIYWIKLAESALLVVALWLLGKYSHDLPPALVSAIAALIGSVLGLSPSPSSNVSTKVSIAPPPNPMPPTPDEAPTVPDVKKDPK